MRLAAPLELGGEKVHLWSGGFTLPPDPVYFEALHLCVEAALVLFVHLLLHSAELGDLWGVPEADGPSVWEPEGVVLFEHRFRIEDGGALAHAGHEGLVVAFLHGGGEGVEDVRAARKQIPWLTALRLTFL